ncbi:MAG: hypothetical protein GPJ54_10635 [Candidatus Heimdallarchaeota archaeon]|nr:hypothetical protein [Candidatus Heimdallarchaeota archaeon]
MQSNVASNTIHKSNFNDKFFPISVDILLILDVFLSSYFFFFNFNRTLTTGLWTVFAIQLIFLPLLIILALVENKMEYSKTIKILGNPTKASFKQPLALTIQENDEDPNVYTNPNEGYMSGLRMGIFLLLAIDIIIILNFLFLSVMVDRIRGVDGGEVIFYYSMLDQAYYLPPLFIMILFHIKLQGKANVDEELTKWQPDLLTTKKSFRSKIKSTKELKRLMMVSIILFLLTFSVLAFANKNEDNQNSIINLADETEFTVIDVFAFMESSQNIEIIAQGNTQNQYGRLYPHLLKFTIDPKSEKVIESKILIDLVRGRERLIDTAMTDNEFYAFTFNSLDWAYTLYKYDLTTDVIEVYYYWDLGITGPQEFIENYSFFTYILSAFNGGVHIIQTEFPHPLESVLTSSTTVRTITDVGVSDTLIDLIVLDALVFEEKTHFLHFSQNFDNFDLTTYNNIGANFSENGSSQTTLLTTNSENVIGVRSPNSASLFATNGAILYRSTENLYDITNEYDSGFKYDFQTDEFIFSYHGLRGVTSSDDVIYLNSETVIDYIQIDGMNKVETAKAINSQYFASQIANMIVYENSVFSSSEDGKIFVWDQDPNAVTDENSNLRNMIIIASIIYLFSATAYFILRRKLD